MARIAVRCLRAPQAQRMGKRQPKKRTLASRKRAKNVDGAREGVAFGTGLPPPLHPSVHKCMSRKLREMLERKSKLEQAGVLPRRRASAPSQPAAELDGEAPPEPRAEVRAPAAAPAAAEPQPEGDALPSPGQATAKKRRRRAKRARAADTSEAAQTPGNAALPVPAGTAAVAAISKKRKKPAAKPAKVRFGETNAAPPQLNFSNRLLAKAERAHTAPKPKAPPAPRPVGY